MIDLVEILLFSVTVSQSYVVHGVTLLHSEELRDFPRRFIYLLDSLMEFEIRSLGLLEIDCLIKSLSILSL